MADEINKRKPNIKPYETAINRMRANATRPTAGIIQEQSAMARQEELYAKAHKDNEDMIASGSAEPDRVVHNVSVMSRHQKSMELHRSNMSVLQQGRAAAASNAFKSEVQGLTEVGTGQLTALEQARATAEARGLISSGRYTETSVARGLNRIPRQIQSGQQQVSDIAAGEHTAANLPKFMSAAESLESSKIKYQNLRMAEKEIKRQGLDSSSVLSASYEAEDSVINRRAKDAISARVASGATGSMNQESGKLRDMEDRFLEAQKKFADALSSGEEDVEGFKKAVVDSTKSMEEQKKLVDEMKRQGSDGSNSMLRYAKNAGQIGGLLQAGGNIALNTLVNADTQQMSIRSGFVRQHNQNFQDHYQATQGDMMALSLVEAQTAGRSGAFGSEQSSQAQGALIAQASGGAIKGGAALLKGVVGGIKTGGLFGAIGGAAEAAVNHSESIAASATDLSKGLTSGQAGLGGAAARRDLNLATNEIKAQARQEFFNTSMGNYRATIGFGGNSSETFSSLQKNRRGFAELGLQAEDVQSIYQTGVQSMGADFTKMGSGGMAALAAQSGRVQAAGVTSAQDYMSRIGQASQTGGGVREIEDVLANAVARGVDNAKSFGDVVEAISSLSSKSAAMGVNTSGAMTNAVLRSMDASKGNGMNERLNLNYAQQQAGKISGISGDTGLNFGTVMEQAELSQSMPELSSAVRTSAAGASFEEMSQIQQDLESGNSAGAMTNARRLGIAPAVFNQDGSVKKGGASKLIQVKRNKIASQIAPFASSETQEKVRSGQKLSLEEESQVQMATGLTGEGLAQLSGNKISKGSLSGPSGDRAAAFTATSAQATGRATMGEAGEATASLSQIATTMQSIANTLQPIASGKTAVQGGAEMKLDTAAFDSSVKTFDQAVKMLIGKLGEKGGPLQPIMPGAGMVRRGGNP